MFEISWSTMSVGCGWAFYGLFFALSNVNYEKFPKFLKIIAWPFSRKATSLWLCTTFLLLVHLGWQPEIWYIYFLPGISYGLVGAFIPTFENERFIEFDSRGAWWKNCLKILAIGLLYGFASLPLMLLHERYSLFTLISCLVFSSAGSIMGFIIVLFKFKKKDPVAFISLVGLANFLLGIGIGLGVNMILY
ncbi:MAG: hypothetical protein ACFFCS_02815 [Candidatus Hodarchaeota archaeon]